MSVQTLYTAATGMEALQHKLDTVANNMANINTTSFKRDRTNFEDLFYRHEMLPGALDGIGNPTPVGIHTGLGSKVQSTQSDFKQGALQTTNRELDIAIEGPGFLKVTDPSGEILYTRAGNLSINANQQLVMGSADTGRQLDPAVTIPPDHTGIVISPTGQIQYSTAGNTTLNTAGQLNLVTFINPQGLLKRGENLYSETPASGSAQNEGPGGANGLGSIRQGSLEASNVEPVQELIDLITTQRAFEMNSQCVQAGDQMMQQIANLRRF